jgi:hypothetical protein
MRNDLTPLPRRFGSLVLVTLVGLSVGASHGAAQDRAAWMKQAQWGVMTHFLADWRARIDGEPASVEHWNELIDHFDVEGLAEQLHSVGAGYYLITIGQNSGYYLAPNPTYDRLVGITPSKCSRRDLIGDLFEPLHRRGIRLLVYLPAGAPGGDRRAAQALDYRRGPDPNREFQINWEQVIRDWSLRFGDKVSGWWFDGCYWPNAMYRHAAAPNFASFAAAARAGNPNSAIAFNPGVVGRLLSLAPEEDYTAGEINEPDKVLIRRVLDGKIDGAVPHVLTFLGRTWGLGEPRFQADDVLAWARKTFQARAVVTFDAPIQKTGLISQPFLKQLQAVGQTLRPTNAK